MALDKVAQDVVVSFHYRLKLDDGSLVEESFGDDPLDYLHGHDNIIPGLENALVGLAVGDKKSVVVKPADAYGEYDDDGVQEVDRAELPAELEPEEGMMLQMEDEDGDVHVAYVIEVTDDTLVLDLNHPMAGETLHFDVEIMALRAATEDELDHGHVHGPEGHHH